MAAAVTGSVAILTEAIHSAIDLIASCIAFFSVRQAESPADAGHRYGHEKFENVAAAAEGVLILVGSGVILYTAVDNLVNGPELESLGFGIAVIAFASLVNMIVSSWLFGRARATRLAGAGGRRRAPAHGRVHVARRARRARARALDRRGVAGPGRRTGDRGRHRGHRPARRRALLARAGRRGAAGEPSWRRSARRSSPSPTARWSATTSCAPAAPARAATSTCTSSSGPARRSSARTRPRTSCRTRSPAACDGADVLIHLEPEDRIREDPIGDSEPIGGDSGVVAAEPRGEDRLSAG